MAIQLGLKVDPHSPIPIRRQLTEQLKHAIEGGGMPRDQALPSIRELAGFLGINANTVARVIEDLKRSGYVEARRGKGVFVAPVPPVRPLPHLRERWLQDVVIRAAALGMTADDVAVGVLSLAVTRPPAVQEAVEVLLVECNQPELGFFARELENHLAVRVDAALLGDLPAVVRRQKHAGQWRVAVTSFPHLRQVERLLRSRAVPVIALLAGAHLETLHRLADLPPGTRVGVVSAAAEPAHSMEHSIAKAGLPNVTLVGSSPADGTALSRLLRRVDVAVCSSVVAEQVRAFAKDGLQVIVDDRVLDPRSIAMLAAVLVSHDGDAAPVEPQSARTRPGAGPSTARRRAPAAPASQVTKRS
jgi:DNA-binding transcriptional regulator YhcF (GntR family)